MGSKHIMPDPHLTSSPSLAGVASIQTDRRGMAGTSRDVRDPHLQRPTPCLFFCFTCLRCLRCLSAACLAALGSCFRSLTSQAQ